MLVEGRLGLWVHRMVGDIENHIEAGAEVRDLVPQPVQIEVVLCRVRGGAGLGKRERERVRVRVRVRVRERESNRAGAS